jgi:hypothetical protein
MPRYAGQPYPLMSIQFLTSHLSIDSCGVRADYETQLGPTHLLLDWSQITRIRWVRHRSPAGSRHLIAFYGDTEQPYFVWSRPLLLSARRLIREIGRYWHQPIELETRDVWILTGVGRHQWPLDP